MSDDLADLLSRASRFVAATVQMVQTADGDHEPATESDHAAHDLACALAHEAARVAKEKS